MRAATIVTDVPKYQQIRAGSCRRVNPEYLALMEPYFEEGMAVKHVAEIFGLHPESVRRYFPDRVWTRKQATELGVTMKHFNEKMRKVTLGRV